MFDSALLRRPGLVNGSYDLGRVFETLLYYRRVHLVLDMQFLSALVDAIGLHALSDLLALPHVTADLVAPGMALVHTEANHGLTVHKPVYATYIGKDASFRGARSIHNFLANQEKSRDVKLSDVERAVRRAKPRTYGELLGQQPQTSEYLTSLMGDFETVRGVIRQKAQVAGKNLSEDRLRVFEHSITLTDGGFVIGSSGWDSLFLDRDVPEGLTWAAVFATIFEHSVDLQLAAELSTDVIVASEASSLPLHNVDLAIQRAMKSETKIATFEELVFEQSRHFRGAINAGELSIADALSVIAKSEDMRKWTSGLSPTSDLAKEYVRAVTEQPTLDRLKPSVMRFTSFTGAGVLLDLAGAGGLGTAIGVALSTFDHFLLQKLINGWRPNTFVNRMRKELK